MEDEWLTLMTRHQPIYRRVAANRFEADEAVVPELDSTGAEPGSVLFVNLVELRLSPMYSFCLVRGRRNESSKEKNLMREIKSKNE